jgi:succinyl-diaminopimelate desuccinylase
MEINQPSLDANVREIVDLTKDLIQFKSTRHRPEEITACAQFIEKWLADHKIPCELMVQNGVPSIRSLPEKRSAPLLLMSHIDVVDADDTLFDPLEKNGRLYGRGAIDDKYAAALSMVLLKNKRSETGGKVPFGILITGDEEVGGFNGAQASLRDMACEFCIALDGGRVDKIVVKEKGVLQLKVVALGKTAHGARPWMGENAIEKLMEDCRIVKQFFTDQEAPQHWHRTMNLSILNAGESINQVPDRAEAIFDIRYTEKDDVDALVRDIEAAISGSVTVKMREPLFIGSKSSYLEQLLHLADGTRTGIAHGASDARFLSQFGIEGIVWGANGNNSQHSTQEHVEIESLGKLYCFLDRFVESLRGNPIEFLERT